MKNFGNLLKQAQDMQTKMQELQDKLGEINIVGVAGAGMVYVTLNGKGEIQSIKIDPSLFNSEDKEVVEDLIVAAFKDAKTKTEQRAQEEMSKLTGGINLPPGIKLPF